jgi:membrane protein YdbS with pleckstrin-like domain
MINQDILNYINAELAKGTPRNDIRTALVGSGWQSKDIDEAFNTTASVATNNNSNSSLYGASQGLHVSEKDYPITKLWIFKAPINIVLVSIIAILFGYYFPYLLIALPIYLIANPLIRANFHYSIEDKFFVVKQGVFSKKQRNLPYGVIQNVLAKQDIFDRIFGLASLRVEDASRGGGGSARKSFRLTSSRQGESVGASGNKVNIPGLRKKDAEALKNIILQKMKENPIEDSQSGL